METPTNEFKMTYYVGVMLAHGGVLSIKEDCLVFSPGAFERTLGASDTAIKFDKIKMVEVTGAITESLMVRTLEKSHKFVGSQPDKIRDKINEAIERAYKNGIITHDSAPETTQPVSQAAQPAAQATPKTAAIPQPAAGKSDKCPSCSQTTRPDYHFCPFCKTAAKPSCPKCYRLTEPAWKFCAICGCQLQS